MKILVVDDDTAVLQTLMGLLRGFGDHEIRPAATGQKAMEHAAAWGGVDLLITDVVMEPMDGFTLQAQMVFKYPAMRTIFLSGFDLSEYAAALAGFQLLHKPLDAEQFRAAVEKEIAEFSKLTDRQSFETEIRSALADTDKLAVPSAVVPVAAVQSAPVPVAVPAAPVVPVAIPVVPVSSGTRPPVVATGAPVSGISPRPVTPAVNAAPTPAVATPMVSPAVHAGVAAPVVPPKATAARPAPVAVAVPTVQPASVASVDVPPPIPPALVRSPAPSVAVPAAPVVPVPTPAAKAAAPVPAPVAVPVPAVAPAGRVSSPGAAAAVARTTVSVPQSHPARPVPGGTGAGGRPLPSSPLEVREQGTPDENSGRTIGDYLIENLVAKRGLARVYLAKQTSVNRTVGLNLLAPEFKGTPGAREQFLADARIKASVQHPMVTAVYEADEVDGEVFYTLEHIEGATLADYQMQRRPLDDALAAKVLKTVSEGLHYMASHNLPHALLDASSIRIGKDGLPRLANLATVAAGPEATVRNEMAVVLQIIRSLVPAGGMPPVLATILSRMQPDSATAFQDWQSVAVALKGTEARVLPAAAAQINAADRAAEAALEATRRENKRGLLIQVGSLGALLVVVIVVVILKFWSNERDLSAQVQIPGGVYPLGDPDNPREVELAPFEIDKYEVSIAQFEEFLKWERENTDQIYKFRHPKEPPGTRHQPDKWEVWRSHAVHGVSEGRKPGRELELNTPVFGVTYWSAWAYAKWKGRSLPTEDQWEAAARGKKLFSYPWGNEWNDKNTNSGVDYDEKISGAPTAGKKDGFATWAPTDRLPRDKSPFGVMSMAGNVAEWVEPDSKTRKPVVKGGSFATEPRPLWFRLETLAAEDNSYVYPGSDSKQKKGDKITLSSTAEYIGFRTVKASGAAK